MQSNTRNWLAAILVLCATGWANAQATVYTATPTGPYPTKVDFTAPCGAGPCQNYVLSAPPSGSFTTASPLAGSLTNTDITPLITSFNFSDGINPYSSTDPAVRMVQILATTDPSGAIVGASFFVERWLTGSLPHAVNDRFSGILMFGLAASALHNVPCITTGVAPSGAADTCIGGLTDASSSTAGPVTLAWSTAAAPAAIPTLSEWGLAIVAGLMALASFAALRRKSL
jgi:hypothetical protein